LLGCHDGEQLLKVKPNVDKLIFRKEGLESHFGHREMEDTTCFFLPGDKQIASARPDIAELLLGIVPGRPN